MKFSSKTRKYLYIFFTLAIITALSYFMFSHYNLYGGEKPGKDKDAENIIEAPHPDRNELSSPEPWIKEDSPDKKVAKAGKVKKGKYPKLLLYSFIHPDYLKETAEFWGTKTGFSGFMIAYVCDWDVTEERIQERIPRLTSMNDECKKYGIDSNFIKLSMGHLKDLDWTKNDEWKKITDRVKLTASVAKQTGFRGIALDTEPYNWRENSIWDYKNPLYEGKTKSEMDGLLRLRGFQFMRAIKEEFPDSEFIIIPQ